VKWRSDDVSKTLLRTLRGHAPRAELVQVALGRLWKTARGDAREVLGDYLLERLPALLGHDFDVDLVLRQLLASVQGLAPASLPMSSAFQEGLALRLRHAPHRDASADAGPLQTAITAQDAKAAARLLRDDDPTHVRLLLGLDESQLRWLAEHGCSTQLANAGVREVARGAFREALRLYDAALFAPELDARVCANPLYAVQDDNNHLGVDEARARRYLERCLPHGPSNPTIFLNAAFVFMELGEHDAALDALAKAKAGGLDVQAQRNEPLLAPLRTREEFKALLRAPAPGPAAGGTRRSSPRPR
jgi:tetratricopeptide (TPR) repeat protein